ncbi:MAG: hypothetical protein DDT19_02321 [Syntrophomonadaceae bacterium]|nr:hypothetical protein [Bacillota bacterium]
MQTKESNPWVVPYIPITEARGFTALFIIVTLLKTQKTLI